MHTNAVRRPMTNSRVSWAARDAAARFSSTARRCATTRLGDSVDAPRWRSTAAWLRSADRGRLPYPVLYCLHGYTGDVGALIATRRVGNQRRPVDRPRCSRRTACRPQSWRSSTGLRAWAARSTVDSIHNGDYATYNYRARRLGLASTRTTARSRPRAAVAVRQVVRRFSGRCTYAWRTRGTFAAFGVVHRGIRTFRYAQCRSSRLSADARRIRLDCRVRRGVRAAAEAAATFLHPIEQLG